MLCQVKTCYARLGKVSPGKVKSGNVFPCYVMVEQGRPG
jgi:hypothetical protein